MVIQYKDIFYSCINFFFRMVKHLQSTSSMVKYEKIKSNHARDIDFYYTTTRMAYFENTEFGERIITKKTWKI